MAKRDKAIDIHKVIMCNAVIKHLSLPLLSTQYQVSVLGMVEYLCTSRIRCSLLQVSIMLGYSRRSSGRSRLFHLLNSFMEAGYITGKTTTYHITELGRNQMLIINNAISHSKIKVRKADPLIA